MKNTSEEPSPARGDTTREALIASAIVIFGRDGFDAASTRAISQAAGVNQALINYHFGGKPGLYHAALRHIADSVSARIGPLLGTIEQDLSTEPAGEADDAVSERALERLHRVTDAFVQMLTSDESAAWAKLILREQQDPSEGFDILYDVFMHRLFTLTTRLVRLVRGKEESEEQLKLITTTVLGQVVVFRAARTVVMRETGWTRMNAHQVETIKALVRRNVTAMLKTEQTS